MTKKKIFYDIMLLFILGVLVITGVTSKLAIGGRWGLGQPVAMADRFLNGEGLFYATPDTGVCAASAYYFPGIVFFSIFIRALFGAQCETVMIVCAWVLIILGLYLFSYISTKIVVGGGTAWFLAV